MIKKQRTLSYHIAQLRVFSEIRRTSYIEIANFLLFFHFRHNLNQRQNARLLLSCRYCLLFISYFQYRGSSSSVSEYINLLIDNGCFFKFRVKLNHFQSVHDQLFDVGSYKSIAFTRKYNINGPVPESLTNYLDVRQRHIFSSFHFW